MWTSLGGPSSIRCRPGAVVLFFVVGVVIVQQVGVLTGHKEVLLGNEKSADFGNGVTYEGVEASYRI